MYLDVLSRINVWSLEGETCHKQLLKTVASIDVLEHAVAVIALDLSKPWTLVASLRKWLDVLEAHVRSLDGKRVAKLQRQAIRRFTSYVDTSSDSTADASLVDGDSDALLGADTLTSNVGVPIVVVGCKSDAADMLERNFDFNDHHFELIEQSLRLVCLECTSRSL